MNIRPLCTAAIAALALAGCATSSPYYGSTSPPYGASPAQCYDCGTVVRIESVGTPRSGATGAVLGGIVGAAAGRELAEDESKGRRNTATVAGAVAGAAAGAAIERNVAGAHYNVHVRMNDGRIVVVSQKDLGGIREGSYVRVYNGRAWLR
ncbi:glycine zipper 2TM domain-containing protein [Vulcaniibacterium gelatinicum]|uniref:glycine zipper 2TM domain-containing protein n=1 Tax=Vulcaniibacterium gelatinicum TaxID=2598725 RepID=UPI0011CC167E|nr:glycine zipper 2TM domain-containing protein [Vulcaniibacterium gelatinicum]